MTKTHLKEKQIKKHQVKERQIKEGVPHQKSVQHKSGDKKLSARAAAQPEGRWDSLQWIAGFILIIGSTLGFSYYTNYPFLYRLFALLASIVLALLLFWKTRKGLRFLQLMKESQIEIRRVVWPTRSEMWQTVLMVALVVFISALVFWLADIFFAWLISLIIG